MSNYEIRDPFSNELLGTCEYDTWDSIEKKLHILKGGRGTQKKIPAFERSDILRKLASLIEKNSEKLAQMVTAEVGKTISDSRVEINRATNAAIASSEEARQIHGEALDSDAYSPQRERIGVVCWRPLGVVLCITPFNFPINIAIHKIGPAFAAGNTMLLKPGPQNFQSTQFLVELCYEAGIPKDVLQLTLPEIPQMAQLIAHPTVAAVNFTGGTAAADSIASAAGYKKLLLELGGNDPLIVMPDANIAAAVDTAINQRFGTAGQRCTAAKRLFVHDAVYDEFKVLLIEKSKKLVVGDPKQDATFVGPVIHKQAADDVEKAIKAAIQQGATLLLGNERIDNIISPTILENITADSILMTQEVFGPLIPLYRFSDLEEIIPVINNSPYGLQAGVFTNDIKVARHLYEELEVGTLAMNDGPGFRAEHFPFGGVKQSGIGREGIRYAIREMSFQKTLII